MKINAQHAALLRAALGLSFFTMKPNRDKLPYDLEAKHGAEVSELLSAGYLESKSVIGQGGHEPYVVITDAGREALEASGLNFSEPPVGYSDKKTDEMPAPAPAPEPKPAPVKRARRAAGKPVPVADDDLVAAAQTPAPAPAAGGDVVEISAKDIAELTAPEIKVEEYVQTIFKPFNANLASLAQEAAVMALNNEEYDRLKAEQDALPADQRREVIAVDVTTKEGMAIAVRMRAGLRDTVRLDGEKARVARKAPLLKIGSALDAGYKAIIAQSVPLEEKFDKAIQDEVKRAADEKAARERAEAERKEALRAKIAAITSLPTTLAGATAAELREALRKLAGMEVTEEEYAEMVGDAALAIDTVGSALAALMQGQLEREEAERERERKQEEERQRLAAQAAAQAAEAARLQQQQEELEQQRKEAQRESERRAQEQAAATRAAETAMLQQASAMEAMKNAQEYAMLDGRAYQLENYRAIAATIKTDTDMHGTASPMVAMARDMAVRTLASRIAAQVAQELPDAWDEAIAEDMGRYIVDTPAAQETLMAADPVPAPAQVDEPADVPETVVEASPEPAPADDTAARAAERALFDAIESLHPLRTRAQVAALVDQHLNFFYQGE